MSNFMATNSVTLEESLQHWREVMAYALTGEYVVINSDGKPTVALIPYEDFKQLISEMEDLQDERDLAALIAEYRKNPDGDSVWDRLVAEQDEYLAQTATKAGAASTTEARKL